MATQLLWTKQFSTQGFEDKLQKYFSEFNSKTVY